MKIIYIVHTVVSSCVLSLIKTSISRPQVCVPSYISPTSPWLPLHKAPKRGLFLMIVQLCVISAHMICSSYLTKYFTQTFAWKHINLKLTLSRIKISKNFYNISLIKQLAPFPTFLSFSFFLCCKFSHLFSTLYLKLTLIIRYANFRFQNYLWYFLIIFW